MSTNSSTDAVCDRAAGADDTKSYQVEFADPSPPRPSYGHNVHLKRRSPFTTYSSSQQSAAVNAGFHRRKPILPAESVSNQTRRSSSLESTAAFPPPRETTPFPSAGDSCHKDPPCLRRYLSPDCTGGKPILPPEVSNQARRSSSLESTAAFSPPRETTPIPSVGDSCHKGSPCLCRCLSRDCTGGKPILPPEVSNQTRRSSSLESTAAFSPPLPLGRTASDPVRFSSLVNHVLPARETAPIPSSDSKNSPTAEPLPLAPAAISILPKSPYGGFDSTQETPSFKRLKRADSANKIRQQIDEINDWIDQMVKEDSAINNFPIAPETEILAETVNNTNEAPLQEEVLDKEKQQEDDLEAEADAVKARKVGECTMLDFKCKCGSGYSVAILGNSCFYKLI